MSAPLLLYYSAPESTQLAVALLGLRRRGWRVLRLPTAALPPARRRPVAAPAAHPPQKGAPARG